MVWFSMRSSIIGVGLVKMARAVHIKLAFKGWFFYDLIILINTNYVMQNPIPNFRQSSIISEKPGYVTEKLKTLASSN